MLPVPDVTIPHNLHLPNPVQEGLLHRRHDVLRINRLHGSARPRPAVRHSLLTNPFVNAVNSHGESVVFSAAKTNHPAVIEALCGAGADPNIPRKKDVDGKRDDASPLVWAASNGSPASTVQALLSCRADPSATPTMRRGKKDDTSPLMWAAAKGNTLLNFAGVRPDLLPFVCDAAAGKQGKYLPGSRIPILPPNALEREKPDTVLVLPWTIADEIKAQLDHLDAEFVAAIPQIRRL